MKNKILTLCATVLLAGACCATAAEEAKPAKAG